jgi:hypothetical protein
VLCNILGSIPSKKSESFSRLGNNSNLQTIQKEISMHNSKRVLFTLVILSIIFGCAACTRSKDSKDPDNKVIARINSYTLTVADFKSEARAIPENLSGPEFEKAKEGLLDDIIVKKILVQEAEAQNFDKDRAFIKEIERYWEQALLKLLYEKKLRELAHGMRADETGASPVLNTDVRDSKMRGAIDAWVDGLKARADIKKYKENLKEIRPKHGEDADGK